jgi:hypothetical protein
MTCGLSLHAQRSLPEAVRRGSSNEAVQAISTYTGEPADRIRSIQQFRREVAAVRADKDDLLGFKTEEIEKLSKNKPPGGRPLKDFKVNALLLTCVDWRGVAQQVSDVPAWVHMYPLYEPCLSLNSRATSAYLVSVDVAQEVQTILRGLPKKDWSIEWVSERTSFIAGHLRAKSGENFQALADIEAKQALSALTPEQRAQLEAKRLQDDSQRRAASRTAMCELLTRNGAEAAKIGRWDEVEKSRRVMELNGCK